MVYTERSCLEGFWDVSKKVVSAGLLVYSIVVTTVMIVDQQTRLSDQVHPAIALIALWCSLVWLARVEGSQASMVGLPPVDRSLYEASHPIAAKVCQVAHQGDNLDRYLMGRQFLVLALVFVINYSGSPADNLDARTELSQFWMESGLGLILLTAMIGQLNTQVTASHCMLDYTESVWMRLTLYACLAVEASGILHASYLIHFAVAKLSGKHIVSSEPERSGSAKVFFWGRILLSTAILAVSVYVTLAAIFEEKTNMWDGVPDIASVIILVCLMMIVGMLEGMQIAFFAVSRITEKERNAQYWSRKVCQLLFDSSDTDGGKGLSGFLIGRQLCVASCFIVIARITTPTHYEEGDNVLGVSDGLQAFFETGLLGAILTTIVASIAWQLVASSFPLVFLGNPVSYVLLRMCHLLEAAGICSFVWVLSAVHIEFMGMDDDVVHIGTAEERAARGKGDHYTAKGGMSGGAFPANFGLRKEKYHHASVSMDDLEDHMRDLKQQIRDAKTEDEKAALQREVAYLEKVMRNHDNGKMRSSSPSTAGQEATSDESTSQIRILDP